MSTSRVLLLGAIAGLTIFVGLPVGRATSMRSGLRAFLNAAAIGMVVVPVTTLLPLQLKTICLQG